MSRGEDRVSLQTLLQRILAWQVEKLSDEQLCEDVRSFLTDSLTEDQLEELARNEITIESLAQNLANGSSVAELPGEFLGDGSKIQTPEPPVAAVPQRQFARPAIPSVATKIAEPQVDAESPAEFEEASAPAQIESVQTTQPQPRAQSTNIYDQPAQGDYHPGFEDVRFLEDAPERTEQARTFDPLGIVVGIYQRIDGAIRMCSFDYLSIPVLLIVASIGTVGSMPFWIDNPEFNKDKAGTGVSNLSTTVQVETDTSEQAPSKANQEDLDSRSQVGGGNSEKLVGDSSGSKPETFEDESDAVLANLPLNSIEPDESGDSFTSIETSIEKKAEPTTPVEQDVIDLDAVLSNAFEQTDTPTLEEIIAKVDAGDLTGAIADLDASKAGHDPALAEMIRAEVLVRIGSPEARRRAWGILVNRGGGLEADLLCARLLLSSSTSERSSLLDTASTLPNSMGTAHYLAWAESWTGKPNTRRILEERINGGQLSNCVDCIFMANVDFSTRSMRSAYQNLLAAQSQLQTLDSSGLSQSQDWLVSHSVEVLSSKVRRTLKSLSGRLTNANR